MQFESKLQPRHFSGEGVRTNPLARWTLPRVAG
jgi:hypothetical protein